jgi:hypothetical protein
MALYPVTFKLDNLPSIEIENYKLELEPGYVNVSGSDTNTSKVSNKERSESSLSSYDFYVTYETQNPLDVVFRVRIVSGEPFKQAVLKFVTKTQSDVPRTIIFKTLVVTHCVYFSHPSHDGPLMTQAFFTCESFKLH